MAVDKNIDVITKKDIPLGDRHNMAFMNTNATRGRGEVLVSQTGMNSEVGHISTMLREHKSGKTPLMQQIDRVTLFIIGELFKHIFATVIKNNFQSRIR